MYSVPDGISPDTKELFLQNNIIEGLEVNQFIHLQDIEWVIYNCYLSLNFKQSVLRVI